MNIADSNINIIGDLSSNSGLSEAARGLVEAMRSIKKDLKVFDVTQGSDSSLRRFLHSISRDSVNIWCINIHAIQKYMVKVRCTSGYNIAYWFWEINSMPPSWRHNFRGFREIWTGSSFCKNNISRHSQIPVYIIPPLIEIEEVDSKYTRSYFKLPEDDFIFLFMYDMKSGKLRKNPEYVIKAFINAFDSKGVSLAIKINNVNQSEIDHLMREIPPSYRGSIYLLTQNMSRDEVNGLINCSDSFVSLHKSEGFGMSIAEAMLLSKTAIATNWSGNTDFMNENNSCQVKYRLVRNDDSYGPYMAGCIWAEPDIEHAATQMSKVVEDKACRDKLSTNGRYTILNNFSKKQVADSILQRLLHIFKMQASFFSRGSRISNRREVTGQRIKRNRGRR